MGVVSRYLIRAHIGPFLFALSAITALIFLNSIAQRVGDLVGKGLAWTVIAEFLVLSLPHVIALALPMAVLVAVLYAFNDLASANEITALLAGGIRPARMLVPVIGLGVLATTVMFYFNDTVLPESNHALKNLILDVGRKTPTLELRERIVNELQPGGGNDLYFLTADRINYEDNTLDEVTIFDANDPLRQRTTYASRGEMAFNNARTDLYLTLYDGVVHEVQSDREGGFQRLYFNQQVIPLREVGNELERRLGGADRGDREMGFALLSENALARQIQLDSVKDENHKAALHAVRIALNQPIPADSVENGMAHLQGTPSMGFDDLLTLETVTETRSRSAREVSLQQTVNRFEVEYHKKLAIALACMVFTLLGPPLALRFPRGGVGLVVAFSSLVFFVYWVGLIAGESMADRRVADPAVTMWVTNVIFLLAGIFMASRMGRSGVNVRGGGFEEFKSTLAAWFSRRKTTTDGVSRVSL